MMIMQCCNGNGLGQFDPVTLTALNSAFVHARDLWNDILQIFGIGAGAREADVITPLQNDVYNTVLRPAEDFVANPDEHTCADFQQMLGAINAAETQFRNFLINTEWADGRAAQQALWWLTGTEGSQHEQVQPWFRVGKEAFLDAMTEKGCTTGGGIGDIFTTPEGGYNWPVIAGVGAVAFMLLRKK